MNNLSIAVLPDRDVIADPERALRADP